MATDIEVTFAHSQDLPETPIEGQLRVTENNETEAYVGTDNGWHKITDNNKANVDGLYVDLTAGKALSAESIDSERQIQNAEDACPPITFGTVGGNAEVQDGYSKFEELRGHTVLWNQLVENGNFADGVTGWGEPNNCSVSVTDGVVEITPTDTTEDSSFYQYRTNRIVGHKYLAVCLMKTTNDKARLQYGDGMSYDITHRDTWQRLTVFFTEQSTSRSIFISVQADNNGDPVYAKDLMLFDLTNICGTGNEPTTAQAFFNDYSADYYDNNAGQLLSCKSATLIDRGKNQFSGLNQFIPVLSNTEYELSGITDGSLEQYDIDKNLLSTTAITSTEDITLSVNTHYVKIQATTYTNIMFYIAYETYGESYEAYEQQIITLPNIELRSFGNIYDVAYQTGGGKRRIGYRDYESGDESDSNVLTDGTHTIYVLAQETDITEVENPGWTELVKVNNFGTLEFTADLAQNPQIPQAYFILYTVNLVEFLDSLYVEAGGDPGGLAPVKSVSAAGRSLTPDANGNVNIPAASGVYNYGLVKFGNYTNVKLISRFDDNDVLGIDEPSESQINNRLPYYGLTLMKLDYAIKAAMTDGIGPAWTDAERLAALLRMGCTVDENGYIKWTATPSQE